MLKYLRRNFAMKSFFENKETTRINHGQDARVAKIAGIKNRSLMFAALKGRANAFTLIEVVAAVTILVIIGSTILVSLNNNLQAAVNIKLRREAFEVARENMETLLASASIKENIEYGVSEQYPNIEWDSTVEAFFEPVTGRMWIRAICGADFLDAAGETQRVELTHWITSLNRQQIAQLIDQKRKEDAYLSKLQFAQSLIGQQVDYKMEDEIPDAAGKYKWRDYSGIVEDVEAADYEGRNIVLIIDGYYVPISQVYNFDKNYRIWKADQLYPQNTDDYDQYLQNNPMPEPQEAVPVPSAGSR